MPKSSRTGPKVQNGGCASKKEIIIIIRKKNPWETGEFYMNIYSIYGENLVVEFLERFFFCFF